MKKTIRTGFIVPVLASLWSFAPVITLAQGAGKCLVNGREVPCEQAVQQLKTVVGAGIGFFIAMIALVVLIGAFWLWMLIHAITKPIPNKALWLVLILLTGIIGSVVYFFVVKRKFAESTLAPVQ